MKLEKSWHEVLQEELEKPYIASLKAFLEEEKKLGKVVYPPEEQVFSAFAATPFDKVKAVIVGQDPYHGPGQAHGLSFSVLEGVGIPPSLKNIYKEMQQDLQLSIPQHGFLGKWAQQGVLMLNATLTVRAGEPKSHYGKGWETFTDAVIRVLAEREDPVVFILWGKSAQEKCLNILTDEKHAVLKAAHPSPYSVSGFLGCRHFSKTNEYLKKWGKIEINFQI